jgi:hypothetical protein
MTLQIFGVRLFHELTEEYAFNELLCKKNIFWGFKADSGNFLSVFCFSAGLIVYVSHSSCGIDDSGYM